MSPSKYNGRRWRVLRPRCRTGALVACVAVTVTLPRDVRAQRVLGPWEDATIVPAGVLRAGISTAWSHANERFRRTGSGVESLGADFTRDSLGPSVFEAASLLTSPLQTLTGLAQPPLSLGRLSMRIEHTAYTTPITLDYGINRRVSIGATIPYIKNRVEVFVRPNPNGPEGTIGLNPAWSVAGARTRNEQVVTELQSAATFLQSELARCQGSSDPTCASVNADRNAAAELVTRAGQAADAVAALYGTSTVNGAPFAPIAGTTLSNAVDAQLGTLSGQFDSFLGAATAGAWVGDRPVPAPPVAYADLQRLLTDSSYGIVAVPLDNIEHSHLGDIEIGAKVLLLDTSGSPYGDAPTPRRLGARLAAAAIVRLPTAQLDSPNDFVDVGTGDRQRDLEFRGFFDLIVGPRFWATTVVRYGMQMATSQERRITDTPDDPFPARYRLQQVQRTPGDFLEVEVAPRWVPNESFSFSASWRYRNVPADTYSGAAITVQDLTGATRTLDPATLGLGTAQREQRLGFAMTFSTLRGYAHRRSPWPMEVSLTHEQVLGGRGVDKSFVTSVGIRLYRAFAGATGLRAATPR